MRPPALPYGQTVRAECDLCQGRAEDVRRRLVPLFARFPLEEWGINTVIPVLAATHLELGDTSEAEVLLERGAACARGRDDRVTLVDVLRVQEQVAARRGDWPEAEKKLEECLSLARAMPYPYAKAKALYVYGQLHTAKREPARARYETALAILGRLGERLYAEQIERALDRLECAP